MPARPCHAAPVTDLAVFEAHRALLLAHAYRMLGDLGRAEDIVQDAWLRWQGRRDEVVSPRAYLITIVTRLCLNELDSARHRREESRGDRLPEPVDLAATGLDRVAALDQLSMAFLVALQRLTPAERAVLLLRDVLELEFSEIGALVGKSEPACRKLLERAREHVATERRLFATPADAHRRLLGAFVKAATAGDAGELAALLVGDAVMVADGGAAGRAVGGVRNLALPLNGAPAIAAFVVEVTRRAALAVELREVNGQPAMVTYDGAGPFSVLLLGVADDRIHRIYVHADAARLGHLGPRLFRP